ncbi:hypothetical protein [Streptomyces sp. DSM 40484]|uniref:hypothetical protein n=1 Tax=Streptomyces kroppenstedtii TaxID=3051181 RepID=UPI0028D7F0CC|nr:hypothetical protein [Streptomyces sp. DSM 40484]
MRSDVLLSGALGTGAAAIVGILAYELAADSEHRRHRRLPFLILGVARLSLRHDQPQRLYADWTAEVHYTLSDRNTRWIIRLLKSLCYTIPLALGGARSTLTAQSQAVRHRLQLLQTSPSLAVRCAGVVSGLLFALTITFLPLPSLVRALILFTPPLLTTFGFALSHALRRRRPKGRRP